MTTVGVKQRVLTEIGNRWGESDAHGVDLRKCLVQPELRQFISGFDEKVSFPLWIVLKEDPAGNSGYMIVYDEDEDNFGLAVSDVNQGLTYIGTHGSFMDTLEGM